MQNAYEVMVVLPAELKKNEEEKILNKIEKAVTEKKGKVENSSLYGRRKLVYPISKHTQGSYWLLNINLDGKDVKSIYEKLKHDEEILRMLVVKRTENN